MLAVIAQVGNQALANVSHVLCNPTLNKLYCIVALYCRSQCKIWNVQLNGHGHWKNLSAEACTG